MTSGHFGATGRAPATRVAECCAWIVKNAVGAQATTEIPLQAGDRVVLYTDGFTESFNSKSDMFGVEGLSKIVWEASLWPLPEMKRHIVDHVSAFRSGPPSDDMSLVVVDMH